MFGLVAVFAVVESTWTGAFSVWE